MPANLTQQYLKAEDAYRQAATPEEELRCLQVMLQEIPKHKGTDHLQAALKAKIASTKKEIDADRAAGKKSGGGISYRFPRQGAGTAIIIGGPNSGKSQLLKSLTKAQPEVAIYPYTTKAPQPGMMPWKDVYVQLIDTPPITKDYIDSYTYGLIRGAEMAILMVDMGSDDGVDQCYDVLEKMRLTKTRLGENTHLDEDDVGIAFTKALLVFNKMDLPEAQQRKEMFWELLPQEYPLKTWEQYDLSADRDLGNGNDNLESLRDGIYKSTNTIRVYTKLPTKKEADRDRPFSVKRGDSLLDLAGMIHKDYTEKLKFARIWGAQVHDGTPVKGDYVLVDGDVVELHM